MIILSNLLNMKCKLVIFILVLIVFNTHVAFSKEYRKENTKNISKKQVENENVFKNFFKKYVVNEENQIFGKNKYGIFVSYGASIDRDKASSANGIEEYDYNPENNTSIKYFWNGGHKYRAVGSFSIHYSSPIKLMNINGRLSIGLMSWHGFNSEYRKRFGAVGVEFIPEFIFGSQMLYFTAGVGPSYVFPFEHYNRHTNMSSQFFFAIVANVGHRFKNGMVIEAGLKHYSNGNLNLPNYGLNMVNITIGYTF